MFYISLNTALDLYKILMPIERQKKRKNNIWNETIKDIKAYILGQKTTVKLQLFRIQFLAP